MKTFINSLLLAFIILIANSCSFKKEYKYRIVFLQCCHDDWRNVMNSEMRRELAFHPDIKFEIIESYSDTKKQLEQIKEIDKQKIDLLIISPNESKSFSTAIDEIYKSGIPVIYVDRKTNSEQYSAFIGADNYEIGKTAGKFIASQFKGRGNVIELELEMTSSPAIERNRGFNEAINLYPELNKVATLEVKNIELDINKKLAGTLKNHPETNIIFAHTDFLALSAYRTAQKLGKAKDLFFVGIDAIPVINGMQLVKNGTLNATLLYPTGGAEVIQTAVKILNKQAYNKETKLLTNVITSDNVNIMLSQIQKIKEQQVEIERETLKINDLNKTYSTQGNLLYFITALLTVMVVLGVFLYFLLNEKQQSNRILEEQNLAILEQKNEIEQISIVVNVATFNSGLSSRDSHMMEVLDGLTYPRIIFSSSSVQYTPEGILVKGKLQFHGVERMIETKVKLEKQNRKLVFSGSLPVLLEDYKVERPGLLFVKVDNKIQIDFQVAYNN